MAVVLNVVTLSLAGNILPDSMTFCELLCMLALDSRKLSLVM